MIPDVPAFKVCVLSCVGFHCLTKFVLSWKRSIKTSKNDQLIQLLWAKPVAKFELECLLIMFIYFNSEFKVTWKKGDLECWFIEIDFEEKCPKFATLQSAFCLFLIKIFKLIYIPSWVLSWLWSLLLVIKPPDTLINSSFWPKIMQNLEFINLKYVSYTQSIWVSRLGPFRDGRSHRGPFYGRARGFISSKFTNASLEVT